MTLGKVDSLIQGNLVKPFTQSLKGIGAAPTDSTILMILFSEFKGVTVSVFIHNPVSSMKGKVLYPTILDPQQNLHTELVSQAYPHTADMPAECYPSKL